MNLPLHLGGLGALEAGAIAFCIGLLAFLSAHAIGRRLQWTEGHALGWATLVSIAIGAGIDMWNLVPLFFVNPGSAARIGAAIAGIHDPGSLGLRVFAEVTGAVCGVLLAWMWTEARAAKRVD